MDRVGETHTKYYSNIIKNNKPYINIILMETPVLKGSLKLISLLNRECKS